MAFIATILCVLGVLALIWGVMNHFKAGRLAKAPLVKTHDAAGRGATVAGPRGAISVEGAVRCPRPLVSPVTGTPCLYYELKVVGAWKEGDDNKSKDYLDQKQAADFSIDDGSGPVGVVAGSGGDFDLEKTFEETKKEGFFADLKNAIGKKEPIIFGSLAFDNPPMSKADKFTCTERVLKVPPRLFVLGKSDGSQIGSPSWAALILSRKTRDQLLGSTAKMARFSLIGGGAGLFVGVALGLLANLISPKVKADTQPKNVAAAAQPAAGHDTPAAAIAPAASDSAALCHKTVNCCKAIAGHHSSASACDNFARMSAAGCSNALANFQKNAKQHRAWRAACE